MGWQAQHNREEDERQRYYAETTWWQRALDRTRTALILAVPIIVAGAFYWLVHTVVTNR